jgi:hypothetical protein
MSKGGYREGSGRSKSGYYNGIYCGSTYELCWVIYNLDHNIKFVRFPYMLEDNGIAYNPDFLLEDGKTIVETKGYEKQESVDRKTKIAEKHGYKVIVLRKENLKDQFEYVEKKYKTKKFYTLYDGYKPQYQYFCNYCGLNFTRDKQIKTQDKFCSRRCAGLFRKEDKKNYQIGGTKYNTENIEKGRYKRQLSREQALEIFNSEESLQILSDRFSITKNAIWFIKQKKTYKWIH